MAKLFNVVLSILVGCTCGSTSRYAFWADGTWCHANKAGADGTHGGAFAKADHETCTFHCICKCTDGETCDLGFNGVKSCEDEHGKIAGHIPANVNYSAQKTQIVLRLC